METSAANEWVTDSAAAMTAMVTGHKTDNGVLSQMPASPERNGGESLKTILEYAEEHGLSTGVITDGSAAAATPAACYAHAGSRSMTGRIFAQVLTPRAGDGVDVIIGSGRTEILRATRALGLDLLPELKRRGYVVYESAAAVSGTEPRVVALADSSEYDFGEAVQRAISILSRNPKGFFLMAEWDLHTTNPKRGLDHALAMDTAIRRTAGSVTRDTLIVFAADHSFDFRMLAGRKGSSLFRDPPATPPYRVGTGHSGEEVLVTAQGPGAGRLHGFLANTDLFHIMMAAFGWERPIHSAKRQ